MKCFRCGFEDTSTQDYCPNCGRKVDMTTAEHMAVLADEVRRERNREVLIGLLRWLSGGIMLLVLLYAAKSVLSDLAVEPLQAHFPPPLAELSESRKLSIKPAMLPVHLPGALRYRKVNETDDTVIEALLTKVLDQAPRHRIGGPDGKIVRGFIISRYGDGVVFFSHEGKKMYAAKEIFPLD